MRGARALRQASTAVASTLRVACRREVVSARPLGVIPKPSVQWWPDLGGSLPLLSVRPDVVDPAATLPVHLPAASVPEGNLSFASIIGALRPHANRAAPLPHPRHASISALWHRRRPPSAASDRLGRGDAGDAQAHIST